MTSPKNINPKVVGAAKKSNKWLVVSWFVMCRKNGHIAKDCHRHKDKKNESNVNINFVASDMENMHLSAVVTKA